jgi:hypothetical protein
MSHSKVAVLTGPEGVRAIARSGSANPVLNKRGGAAACDLSRYVFYSLFVAEISIVVIRYCITADGRVSGYLVSRRIIMCLYGLAYITEARIRQGGAVAGMRNIRSYGVQASNTPGPDERSVNGWSFDTRHDADEAPGERRQMGARNA